MSAKEESTSVVAAKDHFHDEHDDAPEEESMDAARARLKAFESSQVAVAKSQKARRRAGAAKRRQANIPERTKSNESSVSNGLGAASPHRLLSGDILEQAANAAAQSETYSVAEARAKRLEVQRGQLKVKSNRESYNGLDLVEVSNSAKFRGCAEEAGHEALRFWRGQMYGIRKRRVNPESIARKVASSRRMRSTR